MATARREFPSRKGYSREVFCAVCRVQFCCARDRGIHEETEHTAEVLLTARHYLKMLKETKPLACTVCCQVFDSGIFVSRACNKPSHSSTNVKGAGKTVTVHKLIIVPEWAVRKYITPDKRKRSWDSVNDQEVSMVVVHPPADDVQGSFAVQRNLQGILAKQRKADLSDKRARRVTFSPVASVAFSSRLGLGLAMRESEPLDQSPLLATPATSLKTRFATDATTPHRQPVPVVSSGQAKTHPPFVCSPPDNQSCLDDTVPVVPLDGTETHGCVLSPPFLDSNNGSLMCPQMSSTPFSENEDRWQTPPGARPSHTINSEQSETTTQEDLSDNIFSSTTQQGSSDNIFSSIANTICCAFQALPAVLTQLFSLGNQNEQSARGKELPRRQRRRRSASFTPYAPFPNRFRRQTGNQPPIKLHVPAVTSLLSVSPK